MLIIFDCDGVLVDTEPVSNRCFSAALNREGLAWDVPQTMRRLMGRSLKSCVAIVEADPRREHWRLLRTIAAPGRSGSPGADQSLQARNGMLSPTREKRDPAEKGQS